MAKHIETGNKGEDLALAFLKDKGYEILDCNWRFSRAEVDIIAKDGAVLVFVEVKTRTSDYYGAPESFVTPKKEQFLADAAAVYMEKIQHEWEIRFDIIGILLRPNQTAKIRHFEDAFFPELG